MSLSKDLTLYYLSGNVKCYWRFLVALFAMVPMPALLEPFLVGTLGSSAVVSKVMPFLSKDLINFFSAGFESYAFFKAS
jgi:hypothetical protein